MTNSIHLIHPDLGNASTDGHNLLLHVGEHSLSYAIVTREGAVKALFDIQNVEDLAGLLAMQFSSDEWLSKNYDHVKVSVVCAEEILVPDELYDAAKAGLNNFFTGDTSGLITNSTGEGFKALFIIPPAIGQQLENSPLQNIKTYHQVQPLLKLANNDGVYLNFTARSIYILFRNHGKFVFQNNFELANADELHYFLLNFLNIHPDAVNNEVKLSGIVNENDAWYTVIKNYFTRVDFITVEDQGEESVLSDLPAHYFSALLALNACE